MLSSCCELSMLLIQSWTVEILYLLSDTIHSEHYTFCSFTYSLIIQEFLCSWWALDVITCLLGWLIMHHCWVDGRGITPICLVYIFRHQTDHILIVLVICWKRQMFFGALIWNDGWAAEVGGDNIQFFCILIPSWPHIFGVGQQCLGFQCLMACWLHFPHCILNFIAIPFTPQCWSKGCFLFTSWPMDCSLDDYGKLYGYGTGFTAIR